MTTQGEEACPVTPSEFEHIAQIILKVLYQIVEAPAAQQADPSSLGERSYRRAA